MTAFTPMKSHDAQAQYVVNYILMVAPHQKKIKAWI